MGIKSLRESTGLSQRKFADALGVPMRTLQQWEQGRSTPPDYVLKMIETATQKILYETRDVKERRHSIPPKTTWKICISHPFENCEKIYPIQQRKVKMLLDDLSSDNTLHEAWVFGSSVTSQCHQGSDVDLFAVFSGDDKNPKEPYDFEYDLWTDKTVDERLLNEIKSKGVKVYG